MSGPFEDLDFSPEARDVWLEALRRIEQIAKEANTYIDRETERVLRDLGLEGA